MGGSHDDPIFSGKKKICNIRLYTPAGSAMPIHYKDVVEESISIEVRGRITFIDEDGKSIETNLLYIIEKIEV